MGIDKEEIGLSEAALNWLELFGSIPHWAWWLLLIVIFVVSLTTALAR